MRFTWSEEQQLLTNMLHKYINDRCDLDYRHHQKHETFSSDIWKELADLGVLGFPFDEKHGGSGGSPLDTLLIMFELGYGLAAEPYISSIILGGGLLHSMANEKQKSQYIPPLISGDAFYSFAFSEQQSRFNLANIKTQAHAVDGGHILNGKKIVVYGAPESHMIFVTARTSGDSCDKTGISVFLLPKESEGLEIKKYNTIDGMTAGEVIMNNVYVPESNIIGELDNALPYIKKVIDNAISASCGEAVGAMAALNEKCIEYAKTRESFGQPISQFQVIGHRLVDMSVAYEQASAIAIKAALSLSNNEADSERAISASKVKVNQEAAFIGKHAVQLHGAIGITDELDIGLYFKRLTAIQTLFGNTDHHLRRYIECENTLSSGSA